MSEIIIPWYGNHASIPAGWSRYTALDGKFPKASGAESAGVTGGATTHSHASPGHTHDLNAHTHTATSGDSDGGTGSSDGGSNLSNKSHTHTSTSGSASGGTTDSTAVTYASTSNNPPYLELIFIKSTQKNIPDSRNSSKYRTKYHRATKHEKRHFYFKHFSIKSLNKRTITLCRH